MLVKLERGTGLKLRIINLHMSKFLEPSRWNVSTKFFLLWQCLPDIINDLVLITTSSILTTWILFVKNILELYISLIIVLRLFAKKHILSKSYSLSQKYSGLENILSDLRDFLGNQMRVVAFLSFYEYVTKSVPSHFLRT